MFTRREGLVAFNSTLLAERVTAGPDGETLLVIVTTPEKPFMLVTLSRKELDEPGGSITGPRRDGGCRENVGRLVKVPV